MYDHCDAPGSCRLVEDENNSASGSFHEEAGTFVFDKPKSEEEVARQRREDEQHAFARRQVKTNKMLAWFTGALVVATFCTIGVGIWQLVVYRGQLAAMQGQLDQMAKQYPELQKSATASRDSADAADRSIRITQDQMRLDERAWITISEITIATDPPAPPHRLLIHYHNSGKTPGLNGCARVDQADSLERIPTMDKEPVPGKCPTLTLSPQGGVTSEIALEETSATVGADGRRSAYLYGTIWYDDIFRRGHWSQFCEEILWDSKTVMFNACMKHNATGDE